MSSYDRLYALGQGGHRADNLCWLDEAEHGWVRQDMVGQGKEQHNNVDKGKSLLDQLSEAIQQFSKPIPVAVWFVDCISKYYRFLNYVGAYSRHHHGVEVPCDERYYYAIFGLPLYPWKSSIATDSEKKQAPEFCKHPGIWVEMSDRNHFPIILKELMG